MGLWKWVKRKVIGEVFHDYGQVLEWTHGGQTTRLQLQLSHEDGRFFLVVRTSSSAFLSKHIVYSRIEVREADLERMRATLADASERILAKRNEPATQ